MEGMLEVVSELCHKLGQSLQIIDGYASIMLRRMSRDSPQYKYAGKIKDQIEIMDETKDKIMVTAKYKKV